MKISYKTCWFSNSQHTGHHDIFPRGITFEANVPNHYSGFPPFGCSRTIGEAAVKMSVDRLAEIFSFLKNDNECVRFIEERNQK